MRFSIVIPCYNEAQYLGEAIHSLRNQDYPGSYEIVVVDNNCTDDTAAIARKLGARVVSEQTPGVCSARQRGTAASIGEIVISADADTTYAPDWLSTIDRSFGRSERIVAVCGPCRYKDGPLWGKVYPPMLFGIVWLVYLLTGRTLYATATNIAFKKEHWSGYDTNLTQGGDELGLIRNLRRRGRVHFDFTNPTYTSGRRLTRGFIYNFFVTFVTYYLLAYLLNQLFKRQVLGSAPAYRDSRKPSFRYAHAMAFSLLSALLLLLPFASPRHYLAQTSHRVTGFVSHTITRNHHK